MAKFILDGLELSGVPSSAPGFYFNGQVDWFARSESKSEVNERPQAAGAFGIGTDWQSSLAISLKGHYLGESDADVELAMRRLNALGQGGRKVLLTYEGALDATSRVVSIRRVTPDDYRGKTTVNFVIDVIAADPLAYGSTLSVTTGPQVSGGGLVFPLGTNPPYWDFGADGSSGRVSVTNAGTAAVWPSLSASGGLSDGFAVTDVSTGESVRFARPIPVGSTVVINQRTGMASIDGQSDVSGFITQRGFFQVPTGATHQVQFSALGAITGTPQFSVSWAPAYH